MEDSIAAWKDNTVFWEQDTSVYNSQQCIKNNRKILTVVERNENFNTCFCQLTKVSKKYTDIASRVKR